jgi:hypothetical protein
VSSGLKVASSGSGSSAQQQQKKPTTKRGMEVGIGSSASEYGILDSGWGIMVAGSSTTTTIQTQIQPAALLSEKQQKNQVNCQKGRRLGRVQMMQMGVGG